VLKNAMSDFFTAKEIDASMRKNIEKYIDKFKHKHYSDLLDKDWRNNHPICPFCRTVFPDHCFFMRHFRFYKHRWELRLLERIYKYGPRKLEVFDVFYEKKELDSKLHDKVKLWVLSLKIFEALDIMPWWKTVDEGVTGRYIHRLFREREKEAKGRGQGR
jgi:hypothetical protein